MSNHIGEVTRVVVCAANRYEDTIVVGTRHWDNFMRQQVEELHANGKCIVPYSHWGQGFLDQYGVYMNRYEALEVATKAGQINVRRYKTQPEDRLFSEDLY